MTDMNKINFEEFERLNSRDDLQFYSFDDHLKEIIEAIATAKPAERLEAVNKFDEYRGVLKLRGIHGTKEVPVLITVFNGDKVKDHSSNVYNIISVGEYRKYQYRYIFENIPVHYPYSCAPEDMERMLAHAVALSHGYSVPAFLM